MFPGRYHHRGYRGHHWRWGHHGRWWHQRPDKCTGSMNSADVQQAWQDSGILNELNDIVPDVATIDFPESGVKVNTPGARLPTDVVSI